MAFEGVLLVIDASQGIKAQTIANVNLSMSNGLVFIPVNNKINLPRAKEDIVLQLLEDVLAMPREGSILSRAKSGIVIDEILEALITQIPPPTHSKIELTRVLIFDSIFDTYKGVICFFCIFSIKLNP